jgi:hypothetical protein
MNTAAMAFDFKRPDQIKLINDSYEGQDFVYRCVAAEFRVQ